LKEFQKDHGLSPDGRIGINTANALQMSKRERFEQIAINLERLRWEKNQACQICVCERAFVQIKSNRRP
jgi:murein L,D-transpeptidase YcbB/YkuD